MCVHIRLPIHTHPWENARDEFEVLFSEDQGGVSEFIPASFTFESWIQWFPLNISFFYFHIKAVLQVF